MTRPASARLAACLGTGLLASLLTVASPVGSAPASAVEPTPLEVTIESLNPSTIPQRGPVTVTGEIVNRSDETWSDLNVYLLTSSTPMTTEEEVEAATDSDPALEVGARITAPDLYDEVGDLDPGESTSYRLSVPRSALTVSGPGVYWLGVHVLGATAAGRVDGADGRARTFIPLMEPSGPSTRMSLLVPVNGQVRRRGDGTLVNLGRWQRSFQPDGRLGSLLDLVSTDASVPLTWVVDPAVFDAARSVAADNPPLDTTPTDTESQESPGGSPTASPSTVPTEDPSATPSGTGDEEPAEPSEQAVEAADWLTSFLEQAEEHRVLAVPYGNADVAALLRRDFTDVYRRSLDLGADTMAGLGVEADPVLMPDGGHLPPRLLDSVDPALPLLLSQTAAPEATSTVVRSPGGHEVVLTDEEVAEGGPHPGPRSGALAMRQRILAQAAAHALTGDASQPLVVPLPERWNPGDEWRFASFFSGLDVAWLRTVPLDEARPDAGVTPPSYDGRLTYPRAQRRAELPRVNLRLSRVLAKTGRVFDDLLTRNDTVARDLGKAAVLTASANVRSRPDRAVRMARRAVHKVHREMDEVKIDGPPFVTMSSAEGNFQVTVVNDLDEAVTVGIEADTGTDDMTITSTDPVDLGPGQRAVVRLSVTSKTRGLRSVTLSPTTSEGDPLGGSTTFTVRTTQVGLVIWIIMGVGGAVLVLAIARRVVLRVRAARRGAGRPAGESRR